MIAGAGVVAAVIKLTSAPTPSSEGSTSRAAEAVPPDPVPAPPARPRPPPPAAEPPPATDSPPAIAHAKTVRVTIASDPSGASVIDTLTGDVLGRTPLARDFPRASDPLSLSLRKGGYRAKELNLDLGRDSQLDIKLERKPATGATKSADDEYRKL